jgi:hypothetical protein
MAQLINVGEGYHLWSERYDREVQDIFEVQVQDEIAKTIADRLKVTLGAGRQNPLVRAGTKKKERARLQGQLERAPSLRCAGAFAPKRNRFGPTFGLAGKRGLDSPIYTATLHASKSASTSYIQASGPSHGRRFPTPRFHGNASRQKLRLLASGFAYEAQSTFKFVDVI